MSSYKEYLRSAISRIQRDYGDYVPSQFPMHLLSREDIPDQALYELTSAWRDVAANNYKGSQKQNYDAKSDGDEMLHLKLIADNDKLLVIDKRTHSVASVFKMQPDGLFTYYGPRKYATLIGGRGELGDFLSKVMQNYKSLSDRDVLRDYDKKPQ